MLLQKQLSISLNIVQNTTEKLNESPTKLLSPKHITPDSQQVHSPRSHNTDTSSSVTTQNLEAMETST